MNAVITFGCKHEYICIFHRRNSFLKMLHIRVVADVNSFERDNFICVFYALFVLFGLNGPLGVSLSSSFHPFNTTSRRSPQGPGDNDKPYRPIETVAAAKGRKQRLISTVCSKCEERGGEGV